MLLVVSALASLRPPPRQERRSRAPDARLVVDVQPPSTTAVVAEPPQPVAAEADDNDERVRVLAAQLDDIVYAAGCDAASADLWGVPLHKARAREVARRPAADGAAPAANADEAARREALLRALLKSRDGDAAAARKMLENTLRWRQTADPVSGLRPAELRAEHFEVGPAPPMPVRLLAAPESDNPELPRICIRAGTITPELMKDPARLAQWWVCMQEALMSRVFAASPPAYVVVMDCRGLRPHHFGAESRACAAAMAKVMQEYYPERILHTDVVHAPPFFGALFPLLRPFLPPDMVRNIRVNPRSIDDVGELQILTPLAAERPDGAITVERRRLWGAPQWMPQMPWDTGEELRIPEWAERTVQCIDDVRRKKSNELREWIDGLRAAAAPRRLKLPGGDVPERV